MKVKDFLIPYSFKERRPYLSESLLSVPRHYFEHDSFDFDLDSIFPKKQEVQIEYCSGNGDWIIEKAETMPHVNFIAVERRLDRIRKIWKKARVRDLKNLFIVFGDAEPFTESYLPEESLSKSYINFPDPWPKKKHAKNRIVRPDFINTLLSRLKPGGEAIFVTDDAVYKDQMIEVMLANPFFESKFSDPYYTTNWPDYGGSYFQDLFIQKGLHIHYLCFIKK